MIRVWAGLLVLWPLGFAMGQDKAGEAVEPEVVRESGEEYVLFGSGEQIVFKAEGGQTSPPPEGMGNGAWRRTGNKLYIWSVKSTDESDKGKSHPLDGTVTEENRFVLSADVAGSFDINVVLQEEWEDESVPPNTIYWPHLVKTEEEEKKP